MSRAAARRSARILVVDDDPGLLRLLTIRLRSEKYEVEPAENAAKALAHIARFRPDLVITDLRMAQMDGLALLGELKRRWPSLNVIVLTAHGTIPDAVRATQSGAFAFLTKPVEKAQLLAEVRRALETSGFSDAGDAWDAEFLTRCPLVEDALARARLAATADAPVTVTGEPGTGREPLARLIHSASTRGSAPLVDLDCTSLDADDLPRLREAIAAADSGSLLLRNLEELPPALLAELLQALGGPSGAGPRLIATSDRPLDQLAGEASLTEGLRERLLGGLEIDLPPLARRREDIPLLVAQTLEQLAAEPGQSMRTCAPEALVRLASAKWPGNVTQLRAVLREAAMLSPGPVIAAEIVEQALGTVTHVPSFDEARDEFTRSYLVQLLKATQGNVSQAARLARRNRTDLYKLLTRYELSPDEFKP